MQFAETRWTTPRFRFRTRGCVQRRSCGVLNRRIHALMGFWAVDRHPGSNRSEPRVISLLTVIGRNSPSPSVRIWASGPVLSENGQRGTVRGS
jgi:hypothetical protein